MTPGNKDRDGPPPADDEGRSLLFGWSKEDEEAGEGREQPSPPPTSASSAAPPATVPAAKDAADTEALPEGRSIQPGSGWLAIHSRHLRTALISAPTIGLRANHGNVCTSILQAGGVGKANGNNCRSLLRAAGVGKANGNNYRSLLRAAGVGKKSGLPGGRRGRSLGGYPCHPLPEPPFDGRPVLGAERLRQQRPELVPPALPDEVAQLHPDQQPDRLPQVNDRPLGRRRHATRPRPTTPTGECSRYAHF